jgi:hypothetical protein
MAAIAHLLTHARTWSAIAAVGQWLWRIASGGRGRWRQILAWFLAVIIAARIAAPYVLTAVANHMLQRPGDIRGSINGISLSLLTGGYAIHGLHLYAIDHASGQWQPLLVIDDIDCTTEWSALLHGELAGHIALIRPVLTVEVHSPAPAPAAPAAPVPTVPQSALLPNGVHERWQDRLGRLIRLDIDRLGVVDGQLWYRDPAHDLTAALTHISGKVTGLVVMPGAENRRATYDFTADTPGRGQLMVEGDLDPVAVHPTFIAKARLEHVHLPDINPITARFDHLTFAAGRFSGYAEMVADGRRITGYTKVLFRDLDVATYRDLHRSAVARVFWRLVVKAGEEIFENSDSHQQGARFVIAGRVDDPAVGVWDIVGSALRNAFVRPLVPGFSSDGAD